MKFLVDECTGPAVAQYLSTKQFEVFSVYDQDPGMLDDDILEKAFHENWILITNDKDFGEMIFRQRRPHAGDVFLRLADERNTNKIDVLENLLRNHVRRLENSFVVVTERRVRFAVGHS
ncbi:MAG: DUF5615 family PIN-like protein [Ignavibacteriae bacterium]|nr:DUF5615 family PIN-like protein [Ignavibacteriota bacterium]